MKGEKARSPESDGLMNALFAIEVQKRRAVEK